MFLHWWGLPKNHKSEYDVDIYAIVFLTLTVVIYLRLRSVLGQRTHQRRWIPVTGSLLTFTAAALGAVFFDVGGAIGATRNCGSWTKKVGRKEFRAQKTIGTSTSTAS